MDTTPTAQSAPKQTTPSGDSRGKEGPLSADELRKLDAYSTFGDQANEPAIELANRLAALSPLEDARVFLTTGRSGVNAFADSDAWFLIRAVTEPDTAALPRRYRLLLSRGPYHYDDEFALMREHRIDALVTKNSGGDMTRAKLDAAAALHVSVVMVARPPLPAGVAAVGTVQEAADWVARLD